jgi:hypothetical protein
MQPNQSIVAQYLSQNPYKAPQKKKQKGRGGTASSLISEGGAIAGGATGAAIGSVVPVIGTALGGILGAGIGAFGGRIAENKVRDNRVGIGDAAKEGLTTAVLAGPLKAAKYAGSLAKTAVKGGEGGLEEALTRAATNSSSKGIVSNTANKVRTSAGDRSAAGYGVDTGKTYNGKVITPDKQDRLTDFIANRSNAYGGIRAGAPAQQARDAQLVHKNVTTELDRALSAIDRPVISKERTTIAGNLAQRVADDAGINGTKEISDNYRTKILKAKSIRDLENIRKDADNLAFNSKGDIGGTAKAREASHVRDVIDEFVTGLPDDMAGSYKAIKADYSDSKQVLDLVSKNKGKAPKGLPLPFLSGGIASNGVGGNILATSRNKINAGISGAGGAILDPAAAATRTGARMGAQGSLADALLNAQGSNSADTSATTIDTTSMPTSSAIDQQYQTEGDLSSTDQSPYPRESLLADVQRDPKHADDYFKLYQMYQELYGTAEQKPLNSTASGVVADTQTGLKALEELYGNIGTSNVNNPGIGQLRGLNPFDTEAQKLQAQIATAKQIVGKALEGGVLRKEDEYKYAKILPKLGDTDATAKYKIEQLYGLISSRLDDYKTNIGSGGGQGNLEDALLTAGYQ